MSKKVHLFSYMVERWIEWEREITPWLTQDDDEILKRFGFTRLMKLLYFVCLGDQYCLFKIFNNFMAYERGPVEIDIYFYRSLLIGFDFNGEFLCRNQKARSFTSLLTQEKALVDKAIKELKKMGTSFPFQSTLGLIELSQSLLIWQRDRFYNPPAMTLTDQTIREEFGMFKRITSSE